MKRITEEDLVPGNNLLCIDDVSITVSCTGRMFSIDAIMGNNVFLIDQLTGNEICLFKLTCLGRNNRLTFVNYATLTDKEKFVYHLSGKVTID